MVVEVEYIILVLWCGGFEEETWMLDGRIYWEGGWPAASTHQSNYDIPVVLHSLIVGVTGKAQLLIDAIYVKIWVTFMVVVPHNPQTPPRIPVSIWLGLLGTCLAHHTVKTQVVGPFAI